MPRLQLNELQNTQCHIRCSKSKRDRITLDDLCTEVVSEIDSLPVRCVGDWAKEKIFYLIQYFKMFSTGMKDKWEGNINYVEICSGPGRCINRKTGEEFDGTALAIMNSNTQINLKRALFFDFIPKVVAILERRIEQNNIKNAKAYYGDFNDSKSIYSVLESELDPNSLNLVFIDPTDCSLPFSLIRDLKKVLRNIDLIVNVASGTDFNRNVVGVILEPSRYSQVYKKYSQFMDDDDFFKDSRIIQLATNGDYLALRTKFRQEYLRKLTTIGYSHFGIKHIKHYYDLVFATKNHRGIDFWNKATRISYSGQRELLF